MSSRIQILPEDLANKIAAGEVVERPASAVKELVENSIDAGATQIVIEVQNAGKKLIRVADNGGGMTAEEIEIALQRHSTSKISSLDDLFNIKTLGFRGEALPSIASVSKMRIEPNPSGSGITAEVKDLYHNTPARKKFMKSDATELGHIGEIISKYALAFPDISFKFISDGKPLISSSGTGKLADAVLAIYGAELLKELIGINFQFHSGRIFGYVSRPTLTRIDKNYESFFINHRFIRNFLLNRALEEAYRTLIPGNRYPVGIVFVEIDPKKVDVNVHPTKREVKFVNNQEVMDAVRSAVQQALGETGSRGKVAETGMEAGSWKWGSEKENQLLVSLPTSGFEGVNLIPIYQLKNTYIVATDGEELVLIDQHAAHERILYDSLSRQSSVVSRQSLLMPETIECNPAETMILKDNLDYLNSLGFEIEVFGGNSFILRAVPAISTSVNAKQLLADILADMQQAGKSVQLEVKRENIRKLVACHSAIKAGDKLTAQEMNQLIRDLYSTNNPATCPHGRPTMVRLTGEELAARFGR